MKPKKLILSVLSIFILAFVFSACGDNAAVSNDTATVKTAADKEIAINTNATAENKTPDVSNTKTVDADIEEKSIEESPAEDSEDFETQGELQLGKTDSVILYFGEESGDYAGYCFTNDSEAGRKILAACKDREQCEVKGKIDSESECKVPGLEADLSTSGKILKINTAKSLGLRK